MQTSQTEEAKAIVEPLLQNPQGDDVSTTPTARASPPKDFPPQEEPVIAVGEPIELASNSQIRGAMWAGGIGGFIICGVPGAAVGAYAGHQLAKKNKGKAGNFFRKSGDFVSRLGRKIPEAWENATFKHAGDDGEMIEEDTVAMGGAAEEVKVTTLY